MKVPIKNHPLFFVITDVDAGFMNKREVIICANFNSAVKVYRTMCELYGEYSSQICMEVVGYGEKI